MARFEQFPRSIKPTSMSGPYLRAAVKTGPILPDGRRQSVQWAGPHWKMRLTFMLAEDWEVREFRAYVTKMAGGANEFIMPIYDRRQAPWPTGVTWETAKPTVVWDGSRDFSTPFANRQIRVRTTAAQVSGATTLDVEVIKGGMLRRGHYFTINDLNGRARLYQIDEVPRGPITEGTEGTIEFNPPLRGRVNEGAYIYFDDPACTMTLDEVESGALETSAGQPARADLVLRESFGGL